MHADLHTILYQLERKCGFPKQYVYVLNWELGKVCRVQVESARDEARDRISHKYNSRLLRCGVTWRGLFVMSGAEGRGRRKGEVEVDGVRSDENGNGRQIDVRGHVSAEKLRRKGRNDGEKQM